MGVRQGNFGGCWPRLGVCRQRVTVAQLSQCDGPMTGCCLGEGGGGRRGFMNQVMAGMTYTCPVRPWLYSLMTYTCPVRLCAWIYSLMTYTCPVRLMPYSLMTYNCPVRLVVIQPDDLHLSSQALCLAIQPDDRQLSSQTRGYTASHSSAVHVHAISAAHMFFH
ncbi:hypothetical protein ACOMHN_060646 [Nucella lapillus]